MKTQLSLEEVIPAPASQHQFVKSRTCGCRGQSRHENSSERARSTTHTSQWCLSLLHLHTCGQSRSEPATIGEQSGSGLGPGGEDAP